MKMFRTVLEPKKSEDKITYEAGIITLGSCFSDHIGNRLKYHGFNCSCNPIGITFNPVVLLNNLIRVLEGEELKSNEFGSNGHSFFSFQHHSRHNTSNLNDLERAISNAEVKMKSDLVSCNMLVVTFGTAWVYKHISNDTYVANCHKMPQHLFKKTLIQTDEIVAAMNRFIQIIKKVNPNIKIIVTVSPVRHLKDGLVENARSKARLIEAAHCLVDDCKDVVYFPSYEILMDDLRDYRFYDKDMLHPNDQAVDYVWEKFISVYMAPSTIDLTVKVEKYQKRAAHKTLGDDNAPNHLKFEEDTRNLKAEILEINNKVIL